MALGVLVEERRAPEAYLYLYIMDTSLHPRYPGRSSSRFLALLPRDIQATHRVTQETLVFMDHIQLFEAIDFYRQLSSLPAGNSPLTTVEVTPLGSNYFGDCVIVRLVDQLETLFLTNSDVDSTSGLFIAGLRRLRSPYSRLFSCGTSG